VASGPVSASIRSAKMPLEPEEPDYVYGLFEAVIPEMTARLTSLFAPHGRSVALAGVFCHQSPRVSFRVRDGKSWQLMACELGDLLVIVRYREPWGEELNAVLLQVKMDVWPKADSTDAQWRLYTEWPPFDWDFAPYHHRKPLPSGPHGGALHAVIYRGRGQQPLARAADGNLRPRYLGTVLSGTTLLFGGRSIKPRALARAEAQAGWSEVVWDLIDDTSRRLLNRARSKVINQPRGSGTQLLFDARSGKSAMLHESLVAAGADGDEIAAIWGNAQKLGLDDLPPYRPSPRDADDAPAGDGGIPILIIEIVNGERSPIAAKG
jgi:hypothetical protein